MVSLATKFLTITSRPISGLPLWILAIGTTGWYIVVVTVLGIHAQGDVNDFEIMAESYRRHDGDLSLYFATIKDLPLSEQLGIADIFYLAIVVLIAQLKVLLGDTWKTGFIIINVLAMGGASTLLLSIARHLKFSVVTTAFGTILLAFNWEHIHWAAYIGTDVLFLPFTAVVFLIVARAFLTEKGVARAGLYILATVLILLSLTIRPAGLWLLVFFVLAICIRPWTVVESIRERRPYAIRLLAVGLILATIAIITASLLMDDPSRIGINAISERIAYFADYNAKGEVVRARPETFVPPPAGPIEFAKLILLKYMYYFAFAGADFSTSHQYYNYVFFSIYFALVLAGILALFHRPTRISRSVHTLGILAILFLSVFTSAHALTIVDFGWRYRLPCYGPLTLLAMIAVEVYLQPILRDLWARRLAFNC